MPASSIAQRLTALLGERNLFDRPEDLALYEYDGGVDRHRPDLVVFPSSTEDVAAIVRLAREFHVPLTGRGAGTGLSGGAIPREGGIVVSFARMNRILEVDFPNARAVVEPGVINLDVTARVSAQDYFYAPDPSSQSICSIGGNVAENSGGAHCLKYGFTTTHILGLEIVLPDGSLIHLGGKTLDAPGYDLCGIFVGSEGTLGIATKMILRIEIGRAHV